MILERAHGGLHGVESAAADGEDAPARRNGGAHARSQLPAIARIGARATVDDERRNARVGR
jgi:hypothetical protein